MGIKSKVLASRIQYTIKNSYLRWPLVKNGGIYIFEQPFQHGYQKFILRLQQQERNLALTKH